MFLNWNFPKKYAKIFILLYLQFLHIWQITLWPAVNHFYSNPNNRHTFSMLEKLSNYLAYKWLLSWSLKVTCYCVFVYGMWVILKNVFHGKMMTWMDWFKKCCWYANLLKVKFGLLQKNRKHFGNLNYLLILFTKSILYFKFQPYSILAQMLKVEYIAKLSDFDAIILRI